MTTLQILWYIAGILVGWIGFDIARAKMRLTVPFWYKPVASFLGFLIVYTVFKVS